MTTKEKKNVSIDFFSVLLFKFIFSYTKWNVLIEIRCTIDNNIVDNSNNKNKINYHWIC